MRFPQAWAMVAKQNSVLRVAILGVTFSALVVIMISLKFAFKDPLIIERECYSTVITASSRQEPTMEEIKGFIREAISYRFDTDANVQSDFISLDELKNRALEQEEMKRRNVRQKIIVNEVLDKDDSYEVDADRILSVGQLRSALRFPLIVKIQRTSRSPSNPYGLVLLKVSAQNSEGAKK
ncbi:MAG: hypothetical protein AB7G93_00940 [Bdellovibrionales bacterium]